MSSSSREGQGPARSGRDHDQEPLADQLAALARALEQEDDPQQTLDAIVRAAVDTVPGAQHASVSVVQRRRVVETVAATGDLPRAVDQAQYDTGEGPCLDTLYQRETVRVPDLAREQRWPEFARKASDLGVGSMLALQLYVAGDDLGALHLQNEARDAFGGEAEHVGLLFASHAALALSAAQKVDRLQRGMDTRNVIGQATGILMERMKITSDHAFRVLVGASQSRNVKLHEVAEMIATSSVTASPRIPRARPRLPDLRGQG